LLVASPSHARKREKREAEAERESRNGERERQLFFSSRKDFFVCVFFYKGLEKLLARCSAVVMLLFEGKIVYQKRGPGVGERSAKFGGDVF
jgi:hypothetical protein